MHLTHYQLSFLVPEADRQELLPQLAQSLVGSRYVFLTANQSEVFIRQVEVEILPVFRHTEVLLRELMLYLASDEIQRPTLNQAIHYGRVDDGIAPANLLMGHFVHLWMP